MRKEAVLGNRGVGRMPPNRESKLVQMSNSDAVAKLEQSAEAAYQAMYDAKPLRVKDCYEDAQLIFIGPSKPRGWRRSQVRSSG